jgi:hypothetical protein
MFTSLLFVLLLFGSIFNPLGRSVIFVSILMAGLFLSYALRTVHRIITLIFLGLLLALLFKIPIEAVMMGGVAWIMLGVFVMELALMQGIRRQTRRPRIRFPSLHAKRMNAPTRKFALFAVLALMIIGLLAGSFQILGSESDASIPVGIAVGVLISAPIVVFRFRASP